MIVSVMTVDSLREKPNPQAQDGDVFFFHYSNDLKSIWQYRKKHGTEN